MSEGLSVIVCMFNGRERVTRFVAPLRSVVARADFPAELLVVDDGSTDGTVDTVRALGDGVRVVEHRRNRGPSVARNTGILAARYEWLMFCDDDVDIDLETLTGLWRLRDRHACLVPELRDPEGRLQNAATPVWRRGDLKLVTHRDPVPELAYPATACMLVNAQALREAGGFDERFHIYYEDTDAGFALRRSGIAIRMAAGWSVVHHWHGASDLSADRQAQITRRVQEGRWQFAMTALTGRRRAVALALGLPRTTLESLRKRTFAPLRGYLAAMRDIRRMLAPRSRYDLNSRLKDNHRSGATLP
jgi:GT2 family glycosyltransferase